MESVSPPFINKQRSTGIFFILNSEVIKTQRRFWEYLHYYKSFLHVFFMIVIDIDKAQDQVMFQEERAGSLLFLYGASYVLMQNRSGYGGLSKIQRNTLDELAPKEYRFLCVDEDADMGLKPRLSFRVTPLSVGMSYIGDDVFLDEFIDEENIHSGYLRSEWANSAFYVNNHRYPCKQLLPYMKNSSFLKVETDKKYFLDRIKDFGLEKIGFSYTDGKPENFEDYLSFYRSMQRYFESGDDDYIKVERVPTSIWTVFSH
ncbi:MAG: hypothetical protein ACI83O_000208 [Patescibacteria group bacterium]|jgi:hypothetical protein